MDDSLKNEIKEVVHESVKEVMHTFFDEYDKRQTPYKSLPKKEVKWGEAKFWISLLFIPFLVALTTTSSSNATRDSNIRNNARDITNEVLARKEADQVLKDSYDGKFTAVWVEINTNIYPAIKARVPYEAFQAYYLAHERTDDYNFGVIAKKINVPLVLNNQK